MSTKVARQVKSAETTCSLQKPTQAVGERMKSLSVGNRALGQLFRSVLDTEHHSIGSGSICHTTLQRMADLDEGSLTGVPTIVDQVVRSPGHSLEPQVRENLETFFGSDLSHVRVHDDPMASASAEAVQALAYTVGEHIVFNSGRYDPSTTSGMKLVAHEVTHTVQQCGGEPVRGEVVREGLKVGPPSDVFEHQAERASEAMISGAEPVAFEPATAPASLQRQSSGAGPVKSWDEFFDRLRQDPQGKDLLDRLQKAREESERARYASPQSRAATESEPIHQEKDEDIRPLSEVAKPVTKTGEVIKQAKKISEVVNGPASESRITTVLASANSILEKASKFVEFGDKVEANVALGYSVDKVGRNVAYAQALIDTRESLRKEALKTQDPSERAQLIALREKLFLEYQKHQYLINEYNMDAIKKGEDNLK